MGELCPTHGSKKRQAAPIQWSAPIPPPEKEKLEAGLEERETCATCKGKVRAMVMDAEWSGGATEDAQFLVKLYCPASGCGWETRMWRPWSRREPLVL